MTSNDVLHQLEVLPSKIKVVATNALTWLMALQTLITVLVTQAELLAIPTAVEYGSIAMTAIAAVIVFIRRVTPVDADERGLL